MGKPTYKDATVMLKCAELFNQQNLGDTTRWIYDPEFPTSHTAFLEKYPRGSERYSELIRYTGYFETLGTLWKNDLFSEDLLLDWLLIPWDRLSDIIIGERENAGVKRLWENFEALGARQAELNP